MSTPLAYLLTWTCYGSWLHGDARGSVDKAHNVPRTPYLAPDSPRAQRETGRLHHRSIELGPAERKIVTDTIIAHCGHRGWELHAINVRSNHVHVVVTCGELAPETAMTQLKAWSTRRLREAGCVCAQSRVWTHHGSTRYLWKQESIRAAVTYAMDGQGPDLPES